MNKISLEIGSTIKHDGKKYTIEKYLSLNELLGKEVRYPHDYKTIKVCEIESLKQKEKSFEKEIVSDKDWEEAVKRFKIIEPLLTNKINSKYFVEEIAAANNKSRATIYRWLEAYNQTGTIDSLVPEYKKKGGAKKSRLGQEKNTIIEHTINELYLNPQKYSTQYIYAEIVNKFNKANLTPPHINTIRDRINNLPIKDVTQKRDKEEVRDTRGMPDKNARGNFPLEVVQIDHTPLDLILVDEEDRSPIGRAYLTLAIDIYSRMIAGFYISYEAVNFFATGQCILNMIMPKENFLKEVGVNGEWGIYGLPRELSFDNGKEFRGIDITRFCEQYNIQIDWRPVGRSNYGGTVERVFKTLSSEVHNLSGTTFSNIFEKGSYDSNKSAVMTISEVETWFTELVVNKYHKTVHSEIGMTPEEKYLEGIFELGDTAGVGLPPLVQNTKELRYSLLPSIKRSVQKNGITIDHITYFSDVLRKYILPQNRKNKEKGELFICKRDPRDISKIYFYDPDIKKYFEIPYRNRTNPKIDLKDLKDSIKIIKEHKGTGVTTEIDEVNIFRTHKKMKAIEESAKSKTKQAKRKISSKKHLNKKLKIEEKTFENEEKNQNKKEKIINYTISSKPKLFSYDLSEDLG